MNQVRAYDKDGNVVMGWYVGRPDGHYMVVDSNISIYDTKQGG